MAQHKAGGGYPVRVMAERRLVAVLRARRSLAASPPAALPPTVHEAVTRQMVEDLRAELAELRGRVNALLWLVAGAVVADAVLRVAGF